MDKVTTRDSSLQHSITAQLTIARKNLVAVPVERFNNPRGTILVSSVEATVIDLVGYMQHSGGLDRVAGALAELAPGCQLACSD